MKPVPATLKDLAWMTGTWVGPMFDNTLEENWTEPVGGSIASLIRIRSATQTEMTELIIVEEEGDSLKFRVRQFLAGHEPRSPDPMVMVPTLLEDRRVRFEAIEPAELKSLTYARPTDDTFTIDVGTADGGEFQLQLERH